MFGSEKNKPPQIVGAAEKRRLAHKYDPRFQIKSKKEGKTSRATILVLIYILSAFLAYVLTTGVLKDGVNIHTGFSGFDTFFFGSSIPVFTGDAMGDMAITVLLRGFLIFVLAGIPALVSFFIMRMSRKSEVQPYDVFWGTTVGLALAVPLIVGHVFPALAQVYDIFFK